jgi:hypothetical protein
MANSISTYEGNSLAFTCTVTGLDDLVGYNSYFSVYDASGTLKFEKTGINVALVISFSVLNTDNNIPFSTYYYEITINNGTNYFTLIKDTYKVQQSYKY